MLRFLRILRPFLTLGLSELAIWIASRLKTTNDLRRARLIAVLADGVVAELLARFPGASWVELIEEAVRILQTAIPSMPTRSAAVIRREAAAALRRAGVLPPAS